MSNPVRFAKMPSLVLKLITVSVSIIAVAVLHSQPPLELTIHWDKVTVVSNTTPTLQVVVNPPLRPGSQLSAASYKALKDLGADYVRYVHWHPYPRLAVAELEPPTAAKTSWDFSLIPAYPVAGAVPTANSTTTISCGSTASSSATGW